MCRTPPEARAIVEACLYAPKGHRSAFGSGPQLGYAAIPQAVVCKVLNEQTLLMAMIETPEAVENADAIAAVDGIDVLHVGASDCRPRWAFPANTRTSGCVPPSLERRRVTARQWESAVCARISSSRAGCCGLELPHIFCVVGSESRAQIFIASKWRPGILFYELACEKDIVGNGASWAASRFAA
jgi:2-keto-3-deoxy-L-rhamnonate aldolase RhmA